jgi:hypothetical protein
MPNCFVAPATANLPEQSLGRQAYCISNTKAAAYIFRAALFAFYSSLLVQAPPSGALWPPSVSGSYRSCEPILGKDEPDIFLMNGIAASGSKIQSCLILLSGQNSGILDSRTHKLGIHKVEEKSICPADPDVLEYPVVES